MSYYNVLIRVCKSLLDGENDGWGSKTIIQETIKAESKKEVKEILLEKYPHFFANGKVYSRESKDEAQFFYVLIYEYSSYGIEEGRESWKCDYCDKEHPNSTEDEHMKLSSNKFSGKYFCTGGNPRRQYGEDEDFQKKPSCFDGYEKEFYKNNNVEDNQYYIRENSKFFIYKITEKSSGKCYVGQTRNEPFFRWWQHLTKSNAPFGQHLSSTKLSEWVFEVLEELSHTTEYSEILRVESKYITEFDSVENGYNSLISKKEK